MTANNAHTPTTGQVETWFALYLYDYENIVISSGRERFKAWLAERDARIEAAAEQRGAARAFNESANEVRREMRWQYEQNINRNSNTGDSIDRLLELEKVFKYRAAQMEAE